MWSAAPSASARPARRRDTRTTTASARTTAVRANSEAPARAGPASVWTSTVAEASRNPVKSEPQWPSTIRAGCQLCTRNPVSEAARTLSSRASPGSASAMAQTASPSAVTPATVPIAPSEASSRLKALVTRTIHSTARAPGPGESPDARATTTVAAAVCTPILTRAPSGRRSPARPSSATAPAAPSSGPTPSPRAASPSTGPAPTAVSVPTATAIPPRCGVRAPREPRPRAPTRRTAARTTAASRAVQSRAATAAVSPEIMRTKLDCYVRVWAE